MTLMSVLTKKVLRAAPSIAHTIAPCETSTKAIMMTAMATPATTGRAITITIPAIAAMDGATGGKEKSEVGFGEKDAKRAVCSDGGMYRCRDQLRSTSCDRISVLFSREKASPFRETSSISQTLNPSYPC